MPRGVEAELQHVRTPFGPATLRIGGFGVRIRLTREAVARAMGGSSARVQAACAHRSVECVDEAVFAALAARSAHTTEDEE